jgi:hypothetical protein
LNFAHGLAIFAHPRVKEPTMNLSIGLASLAVGIVLILVGWPDKAGNQRKFLRFSSALVLYPPLILAFLALGLAAVIGSLLK